MVYNVRYWCEEHEPHLAWSISHCCTGLHMHKQCVIITGCMKKTRQRSPTCFSTQSQVPAYPWQYCHYDAVPLCQTPGGEAPTIRARQRMILQPSNSWPHAHQHSGGVGRGNASMSRTSLNLTYASTALHTDTVSGLFLLQLPQIYACSNPSGTGQWAASCNSKAQQLLAVDWRNLVSSACRKFYTV